MKRALVTGAAGFVGRHMVAELRRRDWHVIEVDSATTGDALDYFRRVTTTRFDLVVHAAASQPHRAAIDGNRLHMVRNLHLDSAMFNWAVATDSRVLYLSSSAAYPVDLQADWSNGGRPYRLREDDIDTSVMGIPDAAYGWTKLMGEQMAEAVSDRIPVHVVRPFSGYGEDQDSRWPFGAFAERARWRSDPFVIWGNGRQVRDWIHIDDVVRGALAVVEADERRPVNLCTGIGTSMIDLVRAMCQVVGHEPTIELHGDRPAGVAHRVGDPSRFGQLYTPKVTLAEGIERALR